MVTKTQRKRSSAEMRDTLFADESLEEVASGATSPSDDIWSHFAAAQQALSKGEKIGAIQANPGPLRNRLPRALSY